MTASIKNKVGRAKKVYKRIVHLNEPYWTIHPGEFVQDVMDEHNLTIPELVRRMQTGALVEPSTDGPTTEDLHLMEALRPVIEQKAFLTKELIVGLAKAIGGSQTYWRTLQNNFIKEAERFAGHSPL